MLCENHFQYKDYPKVKMVSLADLMEMKFQFNKEECKFQQFWDVSFYVTDDF